MVSFPSAPRLRLALWGVSNPGLVLAAGLRDAGHDLTALVSHDGDPAEADRVEAMLPEVPTLPAEQAIAGADLVIIAGPQPAAQAAAHSWDGGQVPVFTGATSATSTQLPAAVAARACYLDPLTPLAGASTDVARLRGAHIAVTAEPIAAALAGGLVGELGAHPLYLSDAERLDLVGALEQFAQQLHTSAEAALAAGERAAVAEPRDLLSPYLRWAT